MSTVAEEAAAGVGAEARTPESAKTLARFLADLVAGRIRIVDLSETLEPGFPTIVLPPELGQCWPFRIEEISRYDERGPAWYWNNFSCGEHTGTHFDAPIHWVSGKELPNNATDTIPVESFIAEACVLDCSRECGEDPDFLLTIEFVEAWEAEHGEIPPRAWVFMRTDWSKRRDPVAYLNMLDDGQHTPGPDEHVVPWLIARRDVHGFGTESVGTDAGQAIHFSQPFPCHYYMHRNNRYGAAVHDQPRSPPPARGGDPERAAQDRAGLGEPDPGARPRPRSRPLTPGAARFAGRSGSGGSRRVRRRAASRQGGRGQGSRPPGARAGGSTPCRGGDRLRTPCAGASGPRRRSGGRWGRGRR